MKLEIYSNSIENYDSKLLKHKVDMACSVLLINIIFNNIILNTIL